MNIYLFAESDDLAEIEQELTTNIQQWLTERANQRSQKKENTDPDESETKGKTVKQQRDTETTLNDSNTIIFVNQRMDNESAANDVHLLRSWELGITLRLKSKAELKEPLNFLYGLAKQTKCEFVVGIHHAADKEDICYFGHEEGRPDMHEVAMYLGL